MQSFLESIWNGIVEALGNVAGEVIVLVLLLLLFAVLATPIYLLMKALSREGRNTTFKQDLLEVLTAQPKRYSELSPERQSYLRGLDSFDRGLSTMYEYFLYGVMVLTTVLIVLLYSAFQKDVNRQFLQMYFGIAYLVAMLFLVGQVIMARSRRRRTRSQAPTLPEQDVISAFSSAISARVQQQSEVQTIDEQGLEKAQELIDAGVSIHETCAHINSQYLAWNPAQQEFFRGAIQTSLLIRRKAPGD